MRIAPVILLTVAAANAQAMSEVELQQMLNDSSGVGGLMAAAYVRGFMDSAHATAVVATVQSKTIPPGMICIPPTATVQQGIAVVTADLLKPPAKNQDAKFRVYTALQKAWPCKQ